jgi:hypothetical protein
MSLWLKQNAIADLETEHLRMRPHLSQELEPGTILLFRSTSSASVSLSMSIFMSTSLIPLSSLEPWVLCGTTLRSRCPALLTASWGLHARGALSPGPASGQC